MEKKRTNECSRFQRIKIPAETSFKVQSTRFSLNFVNLFRVVKLVLNLSLFKVRSGRHYSRYLAL